MTRLRPAWPLRPPPNSPPCVRAMEHHITMFPITLTLRSRKPKPTLMLTPLRRVHTRHRSIAARSSHRTLWAGATPQACS